MDENIKKDLRKLGKQIQNERKKQKITQEKLAELADTSVDTIKRIEAGKSIALETLLAIAYALDVPASALLPSMLQDKTAIIQTIKNLLNDLEDP